MFSMRRLVLIAVIIAALASEDGPETTLASFTTAAPSMTNTFTAASVVLQVSANSTLSASNLVPGDSTTTGVTATNSGTLPLRYAMTTSVSGDGTLASTLQLTIRTRTTNPCSSLDGTVLYGPGSLSAAAIGNPAYGAHSGDRTLAAGASEDLCFTLAFPASTGTSMQGKNTTPTFTFAAEQQ